jgi:hypothetical protein
MEAHQLFATLLGAIFRFDQQKGGFERIAPLTCVAPTAIAPARCAMPS